jgi:hypothetical protein
MSIQHVGVGRKKCWFHWVKILLLSDTVRSFGTASSIRVRHKGCKKKKKRKKNRKKKSSGRKMAKRNSRIFRILQIDKTL